ncbi:PRD domain-containing protein [Traorella massiliensis]|uniref:PRD domain-containing protein n=1 Tax=Traorella massiliensis TaxID=1903263 RepID=UPI002354718E|nr:PRD domain-containing protein [Traorella massiliensis]
MKVIKNINNNVSLCLDSNNIEVVAFGKGIGFTKPPYEVDLNQVQRTYYDIDPMYINMISDIPEEILDISDNIINYARIKLDNPVSSNIVITLADHINFAIQRYKENMNIKLPIVHDIQYLFETEMEIGEYALKLIKKKLKVFLPKEEAAYIALHIINAESMNKNKKQEKLDEEVIDDICDIIEKDFQIKVDIIGFNYSRFVSHMHYLLKRGKKNEMVKSENQKLYESLINTYPKTYECIQHVRKYLKDQMNWDLSDEECIYLMLHINRLCAREDCYQ